MSSSPEFRLYDFKITNGITIKQKGAMKEFMIQMFAMNEKGQTASITVQNFEPFFYVKVGDDWNESTVGAFKIFIRRELAKPNLEEKFKKWQTGKIAKIYPTPEKDQTLKQYVDANYKTYKTYQYKGLCDIQLVSRHKLYGFDNKKLHKFVCYESFWVYHAIENRRISGM